MCRADVSPAAKPLLARILDELAHVIAGQEGVDRDHIRIGPVDFGPDTAAPRHGGTR